MSGFDDYIRDYQKEARASEAAALAESRAREEAEALLRRQRQIANAVAVEVAQEFLVRARRAGLKPNKSVVAYQKGLFGSKMVKTARYEADDGYQAAYELDPRTGQLYHVTSDTIAGKESTTKSPVESPPLDHLHLTAAEAQLADRLRDGERRRWAKLFAALST